MESDEEMRVDDNEPINWPTGGKGKGKGKATAPVVEEVYAWNCPVTNCGHIHKSIRINNEWLMDETQGAIAMYL